ncbi:hypothetical protein Kpol_1025p40 [Vanderwaltozyma polyspora DSM 70294]|uniref:Actin cytoskeleton-regulatory complex protein SLA1 n=1 Tax=Vanderwaltozyma polyspora (strain ATCC 22028 / DSM 70294 / BCRC 21397 / CBS 2163 / NBRC 10782 / NRRL Y-8283 / UCD 57-17) TaxID=436907 RepID=SLA1_VANPO|nr:uncharacterized protein Kpol_1025p40 [Vanderwaltozyma polyspora DSM 70294]A7TKW4.1 RecName: Full=Actin cytoskeleton-regulatory complex protein SLA1 [Vanderwaltozyma polyspora DSM 70294]EDO17119.1 hypothetical protein Kpol_1025p40 [Vanderwaltozyma polyspora DSM 70294]
MTVFIGIYKAIYNYEPQTPDELTIQEDDLLYLLEKSNVDDWWTVKKRVIGSDIDEPAGLVPSNYVEVADVISQVKAVYDYHEVQNPDEELVFNENDTFDVYDDKDPDWILARSISTNQFGFIPGNYVEPLNAETGSAVPPSQPAAAAALPPPIATSATSPPAPALTAIDISTLPPPPQHSSKTNAQASDSGNRDYADKDLPDLPPNKPSRSNTETNEDDYYDAPPTKPARPNSTSNEQDTRQKARSRTSYYDQHYEDDAEDYRSSQRDDDYNDSEPSGELRTWNVAEIEGRKKRKAKLSIGNNRLFFSPQKGSPQDWSVDKLISYDNEKKHLFLEFVDPYKSLELHTGDNDTCKEILSVIGEIKGASRDPGFKEVEMASKSKKKGNVLYDFTAESNDELTIKQGQVVYIINDQKSKDWWLCELIDSGKRGVVPSHFIEPIQEKLTSSHTGGLFKSIKKFAKGGKSSKASDDAYSGSWEDDGMEGSTERRSRSGSYSTRKRASSTTSKKELPNPKKSRIWEDRSGTFKVEAQFIGCKEGKVHLHKANGVKIAVAAEKLSDDDLVYVERVTGFSLDKYKVRGSGTSSSRQDPRESERERRRRLRENDEKDRDRRLRERELNELQKARQLLDNERTKLQEQNEQPPSKPPRPSSGMGNRSRSQSTKDNYDWFEFFLNSGVDVSSCQRYTSNFEKERITEDMMVDINDSILRTLGLREGDIVRVMKYLDKKLGRDVSPQTAVVAGGMFSEADGSLKNNNSENQSSVGQQLLPNNPDLVSNTPIDDDTWTVRPAAKSEATLAPKTAEFTGSMQDLLDLKPLEPKKTEQLPIANLAVTESVVPEPNLKNLEPVRTGNVVQKPLANTLTGGATLVPLDPFKTGGNNVLPVTTGFVMMPFATGGAMPIQRTGGIIVPQTTFGTNAAGGIMPAQITGGLIPVATTGGLMPQTSFGVTPVANVVPLQRTGGAVMPIATTGGANILPQTTFNLPPSGTVLPIQRTANGLMAANTTGGMMPLNTTGGMMPLNTTGGMIPLNTTGGMMPMNTTGGVMSLQRTGGMMPQTSFGTQQMTGGAMNMMPQISFGAQQMTGGAMNVFPQTSFGAQQMTGGAMQNPNMGTMQNPNMGVMQNPNMGAFQPKSQFGMTLQRTGGAMAQPIMDAGVTGIAQGVQNMSMAQPLQNQPTGFGFGNGPQQPVQANIYNASASNPFGF